MTALCDFSDLPPDQCAHCKGHVSPRRPAASERPASLIEARYPGQCAGCGEPFTVGALIGYDPQSGRWVAECCATNGEVDW